MKHLLICLLFVNLCFASFAAPEWHKGSVVLSDNAVIAGDLSVDAHHHVVLVRNSDNTTSIYPGHRVKRIYFYDEKENMNRRFIALNIRSYGQNFWKLYEVVISGHINVIRTSRGSSHKSAIPDRDDFDYFLLENQEIYSFRQFNAKLIPAMLGTCPTLALYIEHQKLNPFKGPDVIGIVQYYNSHKEEPDIYTTGAR